FPVSTHFRKQDVDNNNLILHNGYAVLPFFDDKDENPISSIALSEKGSSKYKRRYRIDPEHTLAEDAVLLCYLQAEYIDRGVKWIAKHKFQKGVFEALLKLFGKSGEHAYPGFNPADCMYRFAYMKFALYDRKSAEHLKFYTADELVSHTFPFSKNPLKALIHKECEFELSDKFNARWAQWDSTTCEDILFKIKTNTGVVVESAPPPTSFAGMLPKIISLNRSNASLAQLSSLSFMGPEDPIAQQFENLFPTNRDGTTIKQMLEDAKHIIGPWNKPSQISLFELPSLENKPNGFVTPEESNDALKNKVCIFHNLEDEDLRTWVIENSLVFR